MECVTAKFTKRINRIKVCLPFFNVVFLLDLSDDLWNAGRYMSQRLERLEVYFKHFFVDK